MAVVKVQASIDRDTTLPEDRATNTWWMVTPGDFPAPVDLTDITTALGNFYVAIAPSILGSVNGNAVNFRTYNMADPTPRAPWSTATRTIAPSVSNPHPEEVAICLSFQGAQVSGTPQARRRGRVFLGPVSFGTADIASGRLRITSAARTTITAAAKALLDASTAAANWTWVCQSQAGTPGFPADDFSTPVANGWVDDAFDTIRSRGPAATTRTVFTA